MWNLKCTMMFWKQTLSCNHTRLFILCHWNIKWAICWYCFLLRKIYLEYKSGFYRFWKNSCLQFFELPFCCQNSLAIYCNFEYNSVPSRSYYFSLFSFNQSFIGFVHISVCWPTDWKSIKFYFISLWKTSGSAAVYKLKPQNVPQNSIIPVAYTLW